MTNILVPVSTTEDVVSFLDKARSSYLKGKISYEQFCNIEMLELGYNPSSSKERQEYFQFIESLEDVGEFDVSFLNDMVFGPVEGEDSRIEIKCEECDAVHLVGHLDWAAMLCLYCSSEIVNPFKKEEEEKE